MVPKSWSKDYKLELLRELYGELEREFEESDSTLAEAKHISEFDKEADEIIKSSGEIKNIGTGYRNLDKLTGGFDKGELIIVSGATATGKTLFALNCLVNSYLHGSKHGTLIFSLEMTNPQVTARIKQMMAADMVGEETNTLPIYFYMSRKPPTLGVMRKTMDILKKEGKLGMVIIDHLHYFSRVVENQSNEIGHLVREIKSLAMEYDVPIVLIAHTRKRVAGESITKAPSLDDLRDSSFIAQDADMVIMLSRDILGDRFRLNIQVGKNRNKGETGDIDMSIEEFTWRLREN